MAKQDGSRSYETQPEPLLPLSLESWTHNGGLQKFMGPFGPVSPRREVEATLASF